jgi:DNA polymerase-3 subunit beta
MNITINTDVFAAASVFLGVDDIRYYLNGLYLETGENGARLVGSDGHQLAVAKLEGSFPTSSIIIPGSLVAAVKAKAKGPEKVTLAFNQGSQKYKKGVFEAREITLTFGELTTTAKELDGKFPDYRRVVPSEVDGITSQFDPKLISRIEKACTVLGYKSFTGIAYNGDKSALSVINDGFLVVTMPLRAQPIQTSPAWVQEALNNPADIRKAA